MSYTNIIVSLLSLTRFKRDKFEQFTDKLQFLEVNFNKVEC